MSGLHRSLRALPRVAEHIVDTKLGIVGAVQELRVPPGSPALFHYAARPCDLAHCGWQRGAQRIESAAADRETGAAKALADAVRFYCAAFYSRDELLFSTAARADFPCLDGDTLALYSEEQYRQAGFPYVPYHRATPLRWSAARDLKSAAPCYLPAALVRLPYLAGEEEASIVGPTSSGLACGSTVAEATLAALCDAVRDDALAITWCARLPRPHIRVETLSDRNYELVARFEESLGSVTLLDLTLELGIPVVLATLRCPAAQAPALVCAAAADLDPERAVRLALEELALTFRYAQEIHAYLPARPSGDLDVTDLLGHLQVWAQHDMASHAQFLFASRTRVECSEMPRLEDLDPQAALSVLQERAAAAGHRILCADLTSPDVASLGLSVVRVVVPGFYPLLVGPPALRGDRMGRMGSIAARFKKQSSSDAPLPHPFLIKGVP